MWIAFHLSSKPGRKGEAKQHWSQRVFRVEVNVCVCVGFDTFVVIVGKLPHGWDWEARACVEKKTLKWTNRAFLVENYIARNACVFRLFDGGRNPQSHGKGAPHKAWNPLPPVELPLSKSQAYEWSEYNKRHFFLHSPPSCRPFFTPLRISGNVMYVCLCVSAWKRKHRVRGRAL